MKIPQELFEELEAAINRVGGLVPEATMRNRWDAMWRSGFEVNKLYKARLNDDHIDTALRRIAKP